MSTAGKSNTKNALEWTVFGLSAALVLATIGLLIFAEIRREDGPPRLVVMTGTPSLHGGRTVIPVTVTNRGGSVAENVNVRICIGTSDDRREAGFTIDYIPRSATRKGAVSFAGSDPDIVPDCRVLGYGCP